MPDFVMGGSQGDFTTKKPYINRAENNMKYNLYLIKIPELMFLLVSSSLVVKP